MSSTQRLPGGGGALPKNRNWCRCCCCCCCSFIFFSLFIVSAAMALLYFWFDPKPPTFHLQSMDIPRYGISRNPDGDHLFVRTVAQVEVQNPNRVLGIIYGETRLALSGGEDGGINLGEGTAEGFELQKGDVKSLKLETETPTDGEIVDQEEEMLLKTGFKSGELEVTVAVDSTVALVVKGLKTGNIPVSLNCPSAKLKQLQGDGDSPKCTVTVFRWYTVNN